MKTLTMIFKNYSEQSFTVQGVGVCVSLQIARGLLHENNNIIRVEVTDEDGSILGIADRK